ncbi:hypothetical protein [Ornithinibacillus salinisoli]
MGYDKNYHLAVNLHCLREVLEDRLGGSTSMRNFLGSDQGTNLVIAEL